MLGHVTLHEHDGPLGSSPAPNSCAAATPGPAPQLGRVLRDRDRVQVDDAVDGVVGVLQRNPLTQRAQVVAEVERVGRGLDTGEDAAADMPKSSGRPNRASPASGPGLPRPVRGLPEPPRGGLPARCQPLPAPGSRASPARSPARQAGSRPRPGRYRPPATRAPPRSWRGSSRVPWRPAATSTFIGPAISVDRLLRGGHAPVPRLDRDVRAPGQHVVQVPGALVRRRVNDLGAQVIVRAASGLPRPGSAAIRSSTSPIRAPYRCSRCSIRATCRPEDLASAYREFHSAWKPSAPASGMCSVQDGATLPSSPCADRVDRVPGHQPVGGVLAARDHHQARHRVGDRVLPRQLGGRLRLARQQRPQARVNALDIVLRQRHREHVVHLAEHVVDVGRGWPPGAPCPATSRCRSCR